MLNVRGEVIAIVDGHRLLDAPCPNDTTKLRIVIVDAEDERFGVVVDRVEAIVTLAVASIEPLAHSQDHRVMVGTARHNDALLILVDLLRGTLAAN